MKAQQEGNRGWVICRIGRLESETVVARALAEVICRIGSLESAIELKQKQAIVICRIGSLENLGMQADDEGFSYLPYRQLRKKRERGRCA